MPEPRAPGSTGAVRGERKTPLARNTQGVDIDGPHASAVRDVRSSGLRDRVSRAPRACSRQEGEEVMMVSTATARPTPEPLRVIVADDDPDIREILGDIVRRLGHSCQVASDGSEAWAMHQANRADLILSDWQMPKLDGLQLCQRVREGDSALCRTHFIVVSGRTEKRYLVEGLHAGADEFITKPLDLGTPRSGGAHGVGTRRARDHRAAIRLRVRVPSSTNGPPHGRFQPATPQGRSGAAGGARRALWAPLLRRAVRSR